MSIRPFVPSGVKARIRVESESPSLNLVERQDWTTSRCGTIWRIAPVSAPLKAWNGAPGSALIATGAPVIAACFAGSMYIAKRRSGRQDDRLGNDASHGTLA